MSRREQQSSPTADSMNVEPLKAKRPRRSASNPEDAPVKATVHHLPTGHSNRSRAAEKTILHLAEKADDGDIHGMTYIITNKDGNVDVGRVGLHKQNKAIALGTLLQAAVALVMAP